MSKRGKYDVNISGSPYTGADESETAGLIDVKSSKPRKTNFCLVGVLSALLVVVTLLLVGVSVTFGVLGVSWSRSSDQQNDDVCLTEGCVQVSAQIAAAMNQSVDPCDDFYQFACGNWLKSNIVPKGFDSNKYFQNTPFEANNVALSKIFAADDDGGVEAVRKALDLYKSCMDVNTISRLGAQPLRDLINATGGWNLVGVSETDAWSLNSTSFQNEKFYGSKAFFEYPVLVDSFNSSVFHLYISQGGVDASGLKNETAFRDFIVGVLSLIYPTGNRSAYESVADGIVDMDKRIAAIYDSIGSPNFTVYNPFTIDELQRMLFPELDWRSLLQAYYRLVNSSYNATGNETVIVATPNYFRNLSRLYQNLTDHSILQHYSKWKLISGFFQYLSDDFKQLVMAFNQATNTTPAPNIDRNILCTAFVQNSVPIALSRVYTEQVLPNGTKDTLTMTTELIREAFIDRLKNNSWLDATSRQRSIEKAEAILKDIAYPNDLFNDSYVNGLYSHYTVRPDEFFGNYMRKFEKTNRDNVRRLILPVDRTMWPLELGVDTAKPTDVNAFYSPNFNLIIILEGILFPPNFNAGWPDYVNFGAIGAIIGHEISHGFDNTGQRFDKDGVVRQWWTDEGVNSFKSRLPCFVNQYSSYTNEGLKVDGQHTLGENIADNGGLNTAFRAHRNRINQGGTTQRLPSLNYTPDQIFFLAYSQLWCTLYTPEGAQTVIKDAHSPGPLRVFGPLVNSPDFAEAFKCPVGSKMNPANRERCLLW